MSTVRARHGARQLPCPHDHKPVLERKRPVRKATEHFPGKETHLFPIKCFIQMPLFSGANERCLLSVFNLLQRKLLRLDFFLHSLSLSVLPLGNRVLCWGGVHATVGGPGDFSDAVMDW